MSYKLNWLVTHTSPGGLVVQPWLTENNISHSLTQKYIQGGWLTKLDIGLYHRPTANAEHTPGWADALSILTEQLHLPVHLAGLSSLSQQGLSHYLQLGKEQVWVGIKNKQSLPKWFRNFQEREWQFSSNHKLSETTEKDFTTVTVKGMELKASSPELAAYEVVDAIGKQISFEHAAELFQGLVNLSPRKVQSLLNRSSAVQTNRILLYFGHYYGHQWSQRLDESIITLGSGKRQVVKGGRLNERYQITVPESFALTEDIKNG